MELSPVKQIIYGFIAGLSEIFPVSALSHSRLLLKVMGADGIAGLPRLLIHLSILIAIYYSSRKQIAKMLIARRISNIPKKKRKRPLDIRSLLDLRFLCTMMIPVIVMLLFYRRISGFQYKLIFIAVFQFANGFLLYLPQFFPGSNKDSRTLSRVEGLAMGLGCCISAIPGFSGIGGAVSVGSICGVERSYALNMSLLLDILVLFGVAVYDLADIIEIGLGTINITVLLSYLSAAVAAFISTMLAIRIMRNLASDKGFYQFAFYCWGVALFTFVLNLMA